jgi:hypothetical protein
MAPRASRRSFLKSALLASAPLVAHAGAHGAVPEKEALRTRYREWGRLAVRYGADPQSPATFNFGTNQQSLVDAAFLALAVLRAPHQLWSAPGEPWTGKKAWSGVDLEADHAISG